MSEKESILFVPGGSYAFEQQLATALFFGSHSDYKPHFLLILKDDHRFINQIDAAHISYHTLDPVRDCCEVNVNTSSNDRGRGVKRRLKDLLKGWKEFVTGLPIGHMGRNLVSLGSDISRTLYECFLLSIQLWFRKHVARKLIKVLSPRCAIVSQERPPVFLPILKALQEMAIPIILMPAADSCPDASAWLRRDKDVFKAGLNLTVRSHGHTGCNSGIAWLNKCIDIWMPAQIYDSRWGRMLFYTATQTFALRIMRMLPKNPWFQGTKFTDYIMISGIDEEATYVEAQVDSSKLLFFGSHELDVLCENSLRRLQAQQDLRKAYQLDESKRIMVVALPPLWEHGMVSEDVHWRSISEVLRVVSSKHYGVLISLHPRMNPNDYNWIEKKHPIRVCKEPLKDILVVADLFVGVYSSTMRWALALGIPVINIDFWGLDYCMYKNLHGYQTVVTPAELDEMLEELSSMPKECYFTSGHCGEEQSQIPADGKAKERLLQFVRSLSCGDSSVLFARSKKSGE